VVRNHREARVLRTLPCWLSFHYLGTMMEVSCPSTQTGQPRQHHIGYGCRSGHPDLSQQGTSRSNTVAWTWEHNDIFELGQLAWGCNSPGARALQLQVVPNVSQRSWKGCLEHTELSIPSTDGLSLPIELSSTAVLIVIGCQPGLCYHCCRCSQDFKHTLIFAVNKNLIPQHLLIVGSSTTSPRP
jgi:hypothetical protein